MLHTLAYYVERTRLNPQQEYPSMLKNIENLCRHTCIFMMFYARHQWTQYCTFVRSPHNWLINKSPNFYVSTYCVKKKKQCGAYVDEIIMLTFTLRVVCSSYILTSWHSSSPQPLSLLEQSSSSDRLSASNINNSADCRCCQWINHIVMNYVSKSSLYL